MDFSLKCIDHEQNSRFFPRNPNIDNARDVREREEFLVHFARTEQYRKSTIPACQRLLNSYFEERGSAPADAEGAGQGTGARSREGAGQGAEARAEERKEKQGLPPGGGG